MESDVSDDTQFEGGLTKFSLEDDVRCNSLIKNNFCIKFYILFDNILYERR